MKGEVRVRERQGLGGPARAHSLSPGHSEGRLSPDWVVGCQGLPGGLLCSLDAPSTLTPESARPHSPGLVGAGVVVQKGAEHVGRTILRGHPGPGHVHVEGGQGSQACEKRNI